jgi:hypothetical protein
MGDRLSRYLLNRSDKKQSPQSRELYHRKQFRGIW